MSWPKKVYSRSMVPVYTDTNDANMLFRYSGQQRGGKYLDATNNGNNSISVVSSTNQQLGMGMAALNSGVSSPITVGSVPVNSNHTISSLVKCSCYPGVTYGIINAVRFPTPLLPAYGGVTLVNSTAIYIIWFNGAVYRSNSAVFKNNLWNHVVYQINASNNAGYIYLNSVLSVTLSTLDMIAPANTEVYMFGAGAGSNAGLSTVNGVIADGTMWNRALTAADIRNEWLQYAQMVQFKTGWGAKESIANESTVGNFVGNGSTPFEILSGTWKVSLKTVDGEVHKVLECVAAGTVWLDRKFLAINNVEAAYGSWRGLAYHAPNATPTIIAITATAKGDTSATTGYCIRGYNQEARLTCYAAGVFTDRITTPAPGALISMPEFHYVRNFQGDWRANLRLAPGAYGNTWTDWQSSITLNDVTYTTSEGMSFTGNAGDWLSLGTVRDNFALTKFLGEFIPTEI